MMEQQIMEKELNIQQMVQATGLSTYLEVLRTCRIDDRAC